MPQPDPKKSVFINCPFDPDFVSRFDAMVFATVCCGFIPRSALESGSVAEPRMDRIIKSIFSSKYSIHDLSRCKGEGSELLARFNMPLELGIAMARRYMQSHESEKHDWLVLVPEGHLYLNFISDLSGFDPYRYDGTENTLILKTMFWLSSRPDAIPSLVEPQDVIAAFPTFNDELTKRIRQWGGRENTPWGDIVLAASKTVPKPFLP